MNFEDFYKTLYLVLRLKKSTTSVYMPDTMLAKIRKMAKENNVKQGDLILYAVIKTYGEEIARG